MRKLILLSLQILISCQMLLADTGSGDSAAGSLTSNPPEIPTLSSPTNGATGVSSSIVTWNSVTHADSYGLWVWFVIVNSFYYMQRCDTLRNPGILRVHIGSGLALLMLKCQDEES